jgi:thiamine-phosphate diphosphorylase
VTNAIDLYVVVERSVFESDAQWLDTLSELAGLDVPGLALQVRAKEEPPERALSLASEARVVTLDAPVPVLLNGATAEALDLGYQGVHWPEASIPESPDSSLLMRAASVHSVEAAERAEAAGAELLVAGTIFDAGSKPVAGEGTEKLRRIAASTTLPVLAIGGIGPDRVAECLEAGAAGVAVVSSVLRASNMAAAIQALRAALDDAAEAVESRAGS